MTDPLLPLTELRRRHPHPQPASGAGAWNPLPLARETTVLLPAGTLPSGTVGAVDGDGRRYPAQTVDGGLLVGLHLGALEGVTLAPLTEAVPGALWEVDERTIDNGRVRAELTADGQLGRLCWDGTFADLAWPALTALVDGEPLPGQAAVSVLESGPVRALVQVLRATRLGTLRLVYTLVAHLGGLGVIATWDGAGTLALPHPTNQRDGWRRAADGCWAALDDGAHRGLAVVAARALHVSVADGVLTVHGNDLDFAIHRTHRERDAETLGQLALAHGVPARPCAEARPAAFHLGELGGLVPLHAHVPDGWAGEVLFADQGGARGRGFLYPRSAPTAVERSGAGGGRASITREGDGLELEHLPGELFAVRWR